MATNPYQILGVDPKANQDEIKSAYRKLAKKFHPDLNPGNKKAESRFKDITTAYDQVGSVDDRAKFDRGEVEAEAETQYGSSGGHYADQFAGMDEDILNTLFGQMRRPQQARKSKLFQLDVDFRDAVLGGEKEIEFPGGRKFHVQIPAGVESGTKLRFPGKWETGATGVPPGDIYVQLNVKPSLVFRRVGRDIEMELAISFSDAILGAEVKVPTVEGTLLMKIPAPVTSGQKVRLRGKGVLDPVTKLRGDQLVMLKINMPVNVDDEFKKAIKDWSERQPKEAT
jgi:DnaJ-class molecular chaperone